MLISKNTVSFSSLLSAIVVLFFMVSSTSLVPYTSNDNGVTTLDDETSVSQVPSNLENYRLYLGEENSTMGGDGSITTEEPDGSGQQEISALGGVDFNSVEMISDLQIYGQGSDGDEIQLSIYLKFTGNQNATADVDFSLNQGELKLQANRLPLKTLAHKGIVWWGDCSWTINEIFFDVLTEGFTVEQGKQLKLTVDAQVSGCQGGETRFQDKMAAVIAMWK